MKKTITFSDFADAFRDYGREDNFSYFGLQALFEYLEQLEEDCGTEIELDIVAICCEFTEYSDLDEIRGIYWDLPEDEEEALEWLQDRTQVITWEERTFDGIESGIIIGNF